MKHTAFHHEKSRAPRLRALLCLLCFLCLPAAAGAQSRTPVPGRGELAGEPLVDVAKIDPTILVDLRYATTRNITGHPIYPPGTPFLLRRGVADRLKDVQLYLHQFGFRLKIWDAYRPSRAQQILWDLVKNSEVVADPAQGGSRHSWGVAVDVTLVDLAGKDVPMPTDFDDFTAAAKSQYTGADPVVAANLRTLKDAMAIFGFEGIRDEWWHYSAKNWRSYGAVTAPAGQPEKQPAATPAAPPAPAIRTGTNPPAAGATVLPH